MPKIILYSYKTLENCSSSIRETDDNILPVFARFL